MQADALQSLHILGELVLDDSRMIDIDKISMYEILVSLLLIVSDCSRDLWVSCVVGAFFFYACIEMPQEIEQKVTSLKETIAPVKYAYALYEQAIERQQRASEEQPQEQVLKSLRELFLLALKGHSDDNEMVDLVWKSLDMFV